MPPASRVSSPSHQVAYDEIKLSIMSGVFAPGETFSINRLSLEYGFGFTPTREALRRLGAEGAIEIEPKKAMRIPTLSRRAAEDICAVRALVEGEATAYAARRATRATVRKLKALMKAMDGFLKLDSFSRYLKANREFHFTIYDAAEMHLMVPIIEMLWLQVGPLQTYYTPESRQLGHEFHGTIIEAIAANDPEAAKEAMVADIKGGADLLLPFVPE